MPSDVPFSLPSLRPKQVPLARPVHEEAGAAANVAQQTPAGARGGARGALSRLRLHEAVRELLPVRLASPERE